MQKPSFYNSRGTFYEFTNNVPDRVSATTRALDVKAASKSYFLIKIVLIQEFSSKNWFLIYVASPLKILLSEADVLTSLAMLLPIKAKSNSCLFNSGLFCTAGMEIGGIPNEDITASSIWSNDYLPGFGRLDSKKSPKADYWHPGRGKTTSNI